MKQEVARDILKAGRNVFLTGSAGTGKTFLLNKYKNYLKERGIKPAVVAPTGIAASHIDGMTIHSFFGIGTMENIDKEHLKELQYRGFLRKRLKELKVLIIDEVSMVSPELFITMDKILRAFRSSPEPFGGVQLVLSGDFFQLPPVSSSGNQARFAWQTELWQQSNLRICYLEEKFRQEDETLINILDEMRSGEVSEKSMEIFRSRYKKRLSNKFRPTRLYTHNVDVNRINEEELEKIDAPVKIFSAFTKGSKRNIEKLFQSSLVTEELGLKKEAAVIFIKNNFEKGYINGTLGKVVGFTKTTGQPIVEIFSGRKIIAETEEWLMEDDKGKIKAFVEQIPLRLAWALTVHKSQGMTLDAAEINLSKTFEAGQGYVALSRIRSIEGLRLMGLNDMALQVEKLVLEIDQEMKKLSRLNVLKWQSFSEKEGRKMFDEFIIKAQGTTNQRQIEKNRKEIDEEEKEKRKFFSESNAVERRKPGKRIVKGETIEITKRLLANRKNLTEIATERGLAQETVLKHIHRIIERWPDTDIFHLKPRGNVLEKVSQAIAAIKKENNQDSFLDDGRVRLKAIFEQLNEKVPYDDIKLAMLFMRSDNKNISSTNR